MLMAKLMAFNEDSADAGFDQATRPGRAYERKGGPEIIPADSDMAIQAAKEPPSYEHGGKASEGPCKA